MKVLFNLLDAGIGGGQQVALGVAEELVRRGHRVGVVVPRTGPAAERFARTAWWSFSQISREGLQFFFIHSRRSFLKTYISADTFRPIGPPIDELAICPE